MRMPRVDRHSSPAPWIFHIFSVRLFSLLLTRCTATCCGFICIAAVLAVPGAQAEPRPLAASYELTTASLLDAASAVMDSGQTAELQLSAAVYPIRATLVIDGTDYRRRGIKHLVLAGRGASATEIDGSVRSVVETTRGQIELRIPVAFDERPQAVYINGRRALRARAPSVDQLYTVVRSAASADRPDALPVEASVAAALMSLPENVRADVRLVVDHGWETSIHQIQSIRGQSVYVSPKPRYNFLHWPGEQRFYIEGMPTALDEPGEWLYEVGCQCIRYRLRQEERGTTVVVNIPKVERLLSIKNVRGIDGLETLTIKGLGFRFAGGRGAPAVYRGGQSAVEVPGSLLVDASEDVRLSDIEVSRTEGHGIVISADSRHIEIADSTFFDLGGGGIYAGVSIKPPAAQSPNSRDSANTVRGNTIRDVGLKYEGAAAVWLGDISGNCVLGNQIENTGYSGISVGWIWGYKGSNGKRNVVAYNTIKHIGRGRLSDLGGIYTLGQSDGTVLHGNYIEDIQAYGNYAWGAWGIYLDEGSSSIEASDNIVVDAKSGGFHIHYGRENVVSRNLFLSNNLGPLLRLSKVGGPRSVVFSRNMMVGGGDLVNDLWLSSDIQASGNVVFARQGVPLGPIASELRSSSSEQPARYSLIQPNFAEWDWTNLRFLGKDTSRRLMGGPLDNVALQSTPEQIAGRAVSCSGRH